MITKQRAEEIWAKRGIQHCLDHAMTEDERDEITKEWNLMSGDSCFMDAFFRFLNGTAISQIPQGDKCLPN